MKNLEIYVKSSALGKTGIHWRNVSKPEQEEIPSLLLQRIIPKKTGGKGTVNYLVYEAQPSIMLMRYDSQILLEITGIESPERSEKMGRKVLNSVVLVGDDDQGENEKLLRMLAANALRNILGKDLLLSEIVARAIEFDGLEGFKVSLNEFEEFVENLGAAGSNQPDEKAEYKIENKSDDLIEKLADELQNNCLPQKWQSWDGTSMENGVLVVVTEHLEEGGILHKAGVWRGLASNVKEPERLEESISQKPNSLQPQLDTSTQQPVLAQKKIPASLKIILLIVTVVIVIMIVIQITKKPQPEEQPQRIPIPQTLISPQPPIPVTTQKETIKQRIKEVRK
ncbi:hypothetical protein ACE1B6_08405 [Aerosakkonemataceae cyanobacterium BLCC-F154]|uniref:Chalcone-flavonone isomerase family protein n=1 Tax=Floridaenema fluviatile BLCC-F154 TaxID=3153640 RepID=A0ABV4Y8Z0_9CYAN